VIYGTLGNFSRGELSKRDTVSIISNALGSHFDLKYDLMDILQHQDARWAPGDFDLPQLPRLQPAPPFLHPIYPQRIRLPSMSTSWDFDKQTLRSFDPVVMNSVNRHESFGEPEQHKTHWAEPEHETWRLPELAMLSSPVHATPSDVVSIQLTTPSVDHAPAFQPYADLDHNAGAEEPSSAPHDANCSASWEGTEYADVWSRDGLGTPPPRNRLCSPPVPYEALLAETTHLERRPESVTTLSPREKPAVPEYALLSEPSVLGNPISIPIGQPAVDRPPPPPRRRNRKSSVTPKKNEKKQKNNENSQKIEDSYDQPLNGDQPRMTKSNATDPRIPETSRRFIHSVCGKSFATRAKVKKHHWGNKIDDPDTTTGCWARNKKPEIRWNDHPSCKETLPSSNKGRFGSSSSLRSARHRPAPLELYAPLVPTMLASRRHSRSDVPALHGLPHDVSAAQNSPRISATYSRDGCGQHGMLQDDFPPYHTHSLPPRSPFENLLTAVNVAAKIDASVPQGRQDSVIHHLDAQDFAAERNRHYLPAWASHSHYRDAECGQQYLPSPTGNDMGHYLSSPSLPVPNGTAYTSQTSVSRYSSLTMPHPAHDPGFRNPFAPAVFMEDEVKHQDYYLCPPREEESLESPGSPGSYPV
jgi:hypothetical protein